MFTLQLILVFFLVSCASCCGNSAENRARSSDEDLPDFSGIHKEKEMNFPKSGLQRTPKGVFGTPQTGFNAKDCFEAPQTEYDLRDCFGAPRTGFKA